MELTQAEATILRAIAVTYHTETFAATLMDLCKLGSNRFSNLVEGLQKQKLIETSPEELKLADTRTPKQLHKLTTLGNSVLAAELALPPVEVIELRQAKTYKLQVAPDQKALSENLQATIFKGLDSTVLVHEGGREQQVNIYGLVLANGMHIVHGHASDEGWNFTATIKKHAPHPIVPDRDIVFGTIRYH